MRIRSILKPGQRGTKRLVEQYGELFCGIGMILQCKSESKP